MSDAVPQGDGWEAMQHAQLPASPAERMTQLTKIASDSAHMAQMSADHASSILAQAHEQVSGLLQQTQGLAQHIEQVVSAATQSAAVVAQLAHMITMDRDHAQAILTAMQHANANLQDMVTQVIGTMGAPRQVSIVRDESGRITGGTIADAPK